MSASTIELVETRVGQPRRIGKDRHGKNVCSSIGRQPTDAEYLILTHTGLQDDKVFEDQLNSAKEGETNPGQMHGGHDKAVYAYFLRSYEQWRKELPHLDVRGRGLGENWVLAGATEYDVHIGDVWKLGDAELKVTKPRTPCKTLELFYEGEKMIKRMTENGLCGLYLSVVKGDLVPTSGTIEVIHQDRLARTVAEAFAIKMGKQSFVPVRRL